MASRREVRDGGKKGKSCKAICDKGLQGGFVFRKRTHGREDDDKKSRWVKRTGSEKRMRE